MGNVSIKVPFQNGAINLEGLSQITRIDSSLTIEANCSTYFGLHNLDTIRQDLLLQNPGLQASSQELGSLKYIGGNINLNGISDMLGFAQIDSIHGQLMVRFSKQKDFEGLDKLEYVQGDIWISNLDNLESLNGLGNLRAVEGNFFLFGTPGCPLSSLEHLINLQTIHGLLAIESFDFLKNLNGLDGLVELGSFSAGFMSLESLDGLQGITKTESINVNYCSQLTTLTGLENVIEVEKLTISSCNSIKDLTGLNALNKADDVLIYGNNNLLNLQGLENLDTIFNDLRIHRNEKLESFEGFHIKSILGEVRLLNLPQLTGLSELCCLDNIGDSFACNETGITSLTGLEQIKNLNVLLIAQNPNLKSLSGIENLERLRFLYLVNNETLSDIEALANINADSIAIGNNTSITIAGNPLLSKCNIIFLCQALSNQDLMSEIENNLNTCNTREDIIDHCTTRTIESFDLDQIKVFPNPFEESIWIEGHKKEKLSITNHSGYEVKQFKIKPGMNQLILDDLIPGMYFLKFESGQVKKVIKLYER